MTAAPHSIEDDAPRSLEVYVGSFSGASYGVCWDGTTLVDLIFRPAGLEVTDDVIDRSDILEVFAMHDLVGEKYMQIVHGIDLGCRRVGPAEAQQLQPALHLAQHVNGFFAHRFGARLAVADGPAMKDVFFGYVFDFGTREEWTARRGEGAFLDGAVLEGLGPKDEVEVLSLEATRTDLVAERVADMVGFAYRTRVMGSLALSLCHLAAGRVDAVCSLKPARSVDIAAAQLLVRERGLAIDLPEAPPFEDAPLDLAARSRLVAAGTDELCAGLYERLSASR